MGKGLNEAGKIVAIGLGVIGMVFMLLAVLIFGGVITPPWAVVPTNGNGNGDENGLYELSLLTQFTISDLWAGGGVSQVGGANSIGTWIYTYDTLEPFDNGLTDANGVWITNRAMLSGIKYYVQVVGYDTPGTGNVNFEKYYLMTVPYEVSDAATYHFVPLDFYAMGTYAISALYPNGTSITCTTGEYNMTEDSENYYPSFTFMIRNSEDNSGVMSDYYDPVKELNLENVVTIHIADDAGATGTGRLARVTNYPVIYSVDADERYYGFVLEDIELVRDLALDGTVIESGLYSFTVDMNCEAMDGAGTGYFVLTVCVEAYTNLDFFGDYGTHPTTGVELVCCIMAKIFDLAST